MSQIDFTRISNDTNGNPRYVCHYLNLLSDKDREKPNSTHPSNVTFKSTYRGRTAKREFTTINNFDREYELALWKARKIGGKKFHNKQYGGGIVFQSYNITETEKQIKELLTGAV